MLVDDRTWKGFPDIKHLTAKEVQVVAWAQERAGKGTFRLAQNPAEPVRVVKVPEV